MREKQAKRIGRQANSEAAQGVLAVRPIARFMMSSMCSELNFVLLSDSHVVRYFSVSFERIHV